MQKHEGEDCDSVYKVTGLHVTNSVWKWQWSFGGMLGQEVKVQHRCTQLESTFLMQGLTHEDSTWDKKSNLETFRSQFSLIKAMKENDKLIKQMKGYHYRNWLKMARPTMAVTLSQFVLERNLMVTFLPPASRIPKATIPPILLIMSLCHSLESFLFELIQFTKAIKRLDWNSQLPSSAYKFLSIGIFNMKKSLGGEENKVRTNNFNIIIFFNKLYMYCSFINLIKIQIHYKFNFMM